MTRPLLRPGIAAALLLAYIENLADFSTPIVLGGGHDVLSTRIFFAVVGVGYDLGNAATLAIILLAMTLAAFWPQTCWLAAQNVTVTGKSDVGLVAPVPPVLKLAAIAVVLPFAAFIVAVYSIVLISRFVTDIGRMA